MTAAKPDEYPEVCGAIYDNRAACYGERSIGDRFDNIKIALGHCRKGLGLLIYALSPIDRLGAISNYIDLTLSFLEDACSRNYHGNHEEPKVDVKLVLVDLDKLDVEAHANIHLIEDRPILEMQVCERMGVLLTP